MKRLSVLTVTLLAAPMIAAAQPPEWRGDAPPHRHRPPVEVWLENLRERDPEEHARMVALRDEDPAAFRIEMMQRLERLRRRAMDEPLRDDGFRPPHRGRDPRFRDPERREERRELFEAIRRDAAAYRETDDPEEKERLRARVAEGVEAVADARIAHHKRRLEHARGVVEDLERELETRRHHRDQWVAERIEEVLATP